MRTDSSQTRESLDLTRAETEKALRYLAESRDRVVEAVKGLSEAQWAFKPGPDRWSIAEIVEHLGIVEELFVQRIVARLSEAPIGAPDRDPKQLDAWILAQAPDPRTKVAVPGRPSLAEAPPRIVPTARLPSAEALERFLTCRLGTAAFLESPTADHRRRVFDQPALGPLDGYQWVLFIAAHSERHAKQIHDVRSDPKFPAS